MNTHDPSSPAWSDQPGTAPDAALVRLAELLLRSAPRDGTFGIGVTGVHAIRVSRASTEAVHAEQPASLCIIAQGAKVVMLGSERYAYDRSRMLVFSLDLPVAAQVTAASAAAPYLCFRLDLDPERVAELVLLVYPHGVPNVANSAAVFLAQASAPVIDAAARLMALAGEPDEAALLAPLIIDEIIIRLLRSAVGGRLAQLGRPDGAGQRVHKALTWLRANYRAPLRIDELARHVHMSASSLHQHFKSVTSMTPLQFQKVLRLQEARRLMLVGGLDASAACRQVGYVSASQFSREYARLFGKAPLQDVARLR